MRPFVLSCAAVATAFCNFVSPPVQAQQWMRDAIQPEMRVHDFGTVARAAKTEHRFYITNTLTSDLHIRPNVRASCGCTTPIVETETIKPGETGSILARFNTGTFTGQKAATLTVTIDRPQFTELQLNVKGYIRSDVVFNPGEADFGEVPEGDTKNIEVILDYAGRSDWAVESITSPFSFVEASFEEQSRSGGRVQYLIKAEIKGHAPEGLMQNQLVLHTNDRRLTTVPIRIVANVRSPIEISPKLFALGEVKPGETVPQRLVVRGTQPFRILEISSDVADIRYKPIEEAKQAHIVNLIFDPNDQPMPGTINGVLLIKTDLKDEPKRIKVSFDVRDQSTSIPSPPVEVQAAK